MLTLGAVPVQIALILFCQLKQHSDPIEHDARASFARNREERLFRLTTRDGNEGPVEAPSGDGSLESHLRRQVLHLAIPPQHELHFTLPN